MPPTKDSSLDKPESLDLSSLDEKLSSAAAPGAAQAPSSEKKEGSSDTEHLDAALASAAAPGSSFGVHIPTATDEDPVKSFAASVEHKSADQLDKYDWERASYFSPQQWHDLKQLRRDIPIPVDQQRKIFEAKRSGQIEDKGPGFWKTLGESAKSLGMGIIDLMGDANPDLYVPELSKDSPSDVEKLRAMGSPILKLGESADYLAAHAASPGGFDLWGLNDLIGEKYGFQTAEDTFKKVMARDAIDTARAADERAHQSIYSRMAEYPITKTAVKAGLTLLGADKDIPGDKLDEHAQKIVDRWSEQQNYPVNANIELVSSFATPMGLGMEEFALANTALGAFKKALKIPALIRGAEAEQLLQDSKTIGAMEKASEKGAFTRTMGATADALENLSDAAEKFKKAHPVVSGALSTLPGVVVGSQLDKKHPLTGALLGGLGEGVGVKLLGKVDLGHALSQAPRVLADLGEARAVTAGGGKLFEIAGKLPDAGEATKKIFGGYRGRMMDRLSDLALSYGRGGIDMVGLGAALGIIKGEDWEDTKQGIAQGLAYGMFHQTLGKMMGQDPIAVARDQRRKDVEFFKQVQQMDPDTQDAMLKFRDWNTHLSLVQQRLSEAQGRYAEAVSKGDQEAAEEAGKEALQLSEQLKRDSSADLATRKAYATYVGGMVTDALNAINGPFREGQKNVGLAVLNTEQIAQKLVASNPGMSIESARLLAQNGHFFSGVGNNRGIEPGANVPEALKTLGEGKVFDPLKSTVVMNSDILMRGIIDRSMAPADAFKHEFGHALTSIPEFMDLMRANGVEEGLFDTTYKGVDGKEIKGPTGQFSDKSLNDRYWDYYVKGVKTRPGETKKQAEERFAREQGMWDDVNKRWNEAKIADYMKDEVRADVYSKGLGDTGLDTLDSVHQHMLDWARTKAQNSLVRRAVEGILGHGGKDPYDAIPSVATGATGLSPELWSAYRNAFRQFKELNGSVSHTTDEGRIMPMISPLKLAKDPSLRAKYGRDSGLFKTEFQAMVFDKDGKLVGTTTLPTQNAFEGLWKNENGSLSQRSGYGNLPAEASGIQVPEGGTIKISREIVMKPDGETPEMLSRKEIKQLVKTRAQTIRDAIDGAYKGEPGGFRAISDDGLTYRGTFTPDQIAAIRALPESIVPAKVKETILRFNDLLAQGLGHRMLIDYAARVDDRGRAVSFSPKIYDLVPIGMHFSKDGNFLITCISVSRLLDKLNLWGDRLPGRLAPWGGDKEAFFREFSTKYLPNHLKKWENPELPPDERVKEENLVARPGETELDKNPEVAKQKKAIFNDFLNLTSNEFRDKNPDRTVVPRRKGDPRGKDPNRTIMSVRADAVADMLESSAHPLPVNYELQKWNFLPEKGGVSFAPKGEEPALTPKEETNPILRAMGAAGRTPYAQATKNANQDVQRISEDYVKGAGMEYRPHGQAVPVNEELAKRIADHYETAKNEPMKPEVKKAYTALADETVAQWQAFQKAGYTATPWTKKGQPYANSAEMMKDVRDNKHLYYFQTEQGFGEKGITPEMRESTPMLQPSGVDFGEAKNVPVNDVFRVVHDIVGHGAQGYEFGPKGEFNAYLEHSRMYSDEAKPALAVDTLAQNSWVNYGPHLRDREGNLPKKGEQGYMPPSERPFADQKILTIPKTFLDAVDKYAAEQKGPSFLPEKETEKTDFRSFFSGVTRGTMQKSEKSFFPVIPFQNSELRRTIEAKEKHSGNFDDHIKKSIPTFYETQIGTIHALGKALPKGSQVLDIAAGEGSYGKALTEISGGNVRTVSLEPNPDMADFFGKKSQVSGAEYSTHAFGAGWTEADGTVVNKFEPKERFDAVHEAMGFQFISPDRETQVAEVKRLLKPDGIFLTEEKLMNPDWAANEKLKDTEHKAKYFDPETLKAKDKMVGFSGEKPVSYSQTQDDVKSQGMVANQVGQGQLESILSKNFSHVAQYWDAGNFKGYVASDSPEALQRFLDNLPSLKSKFSTAETPRMVTGEKPVDSQGQKPVNQEINQPITTDATKQTPQYLPSKGAAPEGYPQAQGAKPEDSQAGERERIRLHSGLAAIARAAQGAGEEGVQGASGAASRKEVEAKALLEHAEEAGLLTDPDAFFNQWQLDGSEAGGEHQVSFPPGPDVIKRTPNPNYPTWADYYDSLNIHNALFPKAALTARGLQNVEGSGGVDIDGQKWPSGLYSEVSQPFLEISRGLSVPETDELMKTRGFYRVRPMEYYSPELKIHMTDLHGMNAVMLKDENGKEFPYVIDSYIRPTGEKDAADVARVEARIKTEGTEDELPPDIRFLPAKKGEQLTVQHPSEEKEGSVGGDLDLVHFGAYGVSTADPKKMGKGSATGIDRSGLPKTYFYLNGTKYESGIQEQTPYLAKVDGNSIYDLDADPLGLKQANREAMDKAIQDAGFTGYMSRKKEGQTFDAVALFKKTKLSEALPTDVFSKKEAKRRMEAGGPEVDYAAQDEAFYGPSFLPAKPQATFDDFKGEKVKELNDRSGWAIFTAQNPSARKDISPEENAKLNNQLEEDLKKAGLEYKKVNGSYGQPEKSFIVLDPSLDRKKASELAKKYNQESVLTNEGLVYQDGSVAPSKGIVLHSEKPEDYYTEHEGTYFASDIGGPRIPAEGQLEEKSPGQQILEGTLEPEGMPNRPRVDEIARWFQDRYGKPLTYDGRQTKRPQLIKQLVNEVAHAFKLHPEAAGWYDENISRMLSIAEELDPDLKKPENRFIFKAVLAATSDGSEVSDQFNDTWDIYQRWKKGQGLSADGIAAARSETIKGHVLKIKKLIDLLGHKGAEEWMNRKGTVKELRESAVKDLGFSKEDAMKLVNGELTTTQVPFAAILGPKLGSFYNNLNGDHTTVTMDRWFMRTLGRLTGTQLERLTGADMYGFRQRLRDAFNNLSTEEQKSLKLSKSALFGTGADTVAKKLAGHFMDAKNRANVSPEMDELRKAANDLKKKGAPLVEAPANGSHRLWIREVVSDVQKELKAQGIEIENADLQALLWYAEKELYGKLGYRERSRSADYASAAEALHQRVSGRPSRLAADTSGRVGQLGRSQSD